jgi:signal transduction histidine kinase
MTRMATPGFDNVHNFGPAIMAPLVDANGVRGAVLLMRTADRLPFTSRDLDQATTFATQVALALEFNDARAHAEELRALEVRHSIAQNLHDNVMQRLFATGVGLQQLAESPLPPEVAARLQQSVDDLDETIDAIRTQVFGLREDEADPPATGSAETSQRLP